MKHAGGIADDTGIADCKDARRMVDAFESAGTETFDLTRTNLYEKIVDFRPRVPVERLRRIIPAELEVVGRTQRNLIVRPRAKSVDFIQLDNLNETQLARVRPIALLTVQNSQRGNQAWIALEAPQDRDFTRRVRKATVADLMASGAVRIAGIQKRIA